MQPVLLMWLLLLQAPSAPPTFQASLYAGNEAVAPGSETPIALVLQIENRWHIYDPIVLDTGLATRIEMETPAGVSVDDWRFPTPLLGELEGIEYLAHEGTITLLSALRVDPDLAGTTPLNIKAKVRALACIEACIPVSAEAELVLPVANSVGPEVNQERFRKARQALPKPIADAPFIVGSRLLASHEQLSIGESGFVAAEIVVAPNHHILDRDPGVEGLIPTRLFIESLPGILFKEKEQRWPAAKQKPLPEIGTIRELSGKVVVAAPFELNDSRFQPRRVRLRALLQYQSCSDDGTCFQPEMAAGTVEFEVTPTGGPVLANPGFNRLSIPEPSAARVGSSGDSAVTVAERPRGASPKPPPLLLVFCFAFLGGAILNIMPCVLPVISLKIFSFMQQAGEDAGKVLRLGVAYTIGILLSFAILGLVMTQSGIAWGGLMQHAAYVIVLIAVVFAFGLSMFGVFELRLPGIVENAAGAVTTKEGYGGAMLNGVLATALATPCTAPLLGWALGVLVQFPQSVMFAGIMTIGVGLAAPYLLLTAFPGWLKFLPRPGQWMITFKQFMGFVLMGTCVWLFWNLSYLADPLAIVATLSALCFVGAACWLIGRLSLSSSVGATIGAYLIATAAVGGGSIASFWFFTPEGLVAESAESRQSKSATPVASGDWHPWHPGLPEQLAEEGYTVYVDFTAKWCATCQANKRLVLQSDAIEAKLRTMNVVPLIADFTRPNPAIQDELRRHGRFGVPLNLIYPAGRPNMPIILPELLTVRVVSDELDAAGASKVTTPFAKR